MVATKKGQWHMSLFGGLTVAYDGGPESRIRSKKAGGILGYLAYFKGQAFSRESLSDQYWPECDPETARQNLRAALAILRRQLEPDGMDGALLMADRDGVWLNSDVVSTDVSLFFELAAGAEQEEPESRAKLLTEAMALVRGPLLPGHEGMWILPQQFHLDEEAAQVAVRAVQAVCELRDFEGAVRVGKAALAKWPLREDIHIAVMKAHALAGKPAEAIHQYEELERLLDEQWGETPSAEARFVLDNLPTQLVVPSLAVHEAPAPRFEPAKVPARLTSFVGRTAEVTEVMACVEPASSNQNRLVTILGPGGCGKTRLCMELGQAIAGRFEGRVWYVPLADIEDGSLIPLEIRKVLGLEVSPRSDAMAQVTGFFGQSPSALLLDNFEQLVESGALVVSSLLETCPNLVCIVTSRRALTVEGERPLFIKPLPLPTKEATVAELEQCESVRLFLDRAIAVRPDFRLSGSNAAVVAELCRRLDGLPLAIELAASRMSTMGPAQILGKLGQANVFLTSRLQTTPERHRSLRATVEWSVRLLSDEAKRVFRRMSVFRGGWTLDAASYLCGGDWVEEEVQTLVDSSLVQTESRDEDVKFTMLEAVREQALAMLIESGEEGDVRRCHLEYFAKVVGETAPGLHRERQGEVADRIEAEMDNLREAAAWAARQEECPEAALTMVGSIRSFFGFRGHFEGWYEALNALLTLPYSGSGGARAKALLCAGSLGFYHAAFERAKSAYEEARRLSEVSGDSGLLTEAVFGIGVACRALGDLDAAFVNYYEALEISKSANVPHVSCKIHYNIGLLTEFLDRFEEAKEHYELSRRIAEIAHDKRVVARDRDALGRCALHDGDPETAILHHEEARRLMAEVGDRNGENEVLGNIALMEFTLGRFDKALPLFAETLDLSWQMQNTWELRSNVAYMAACLAALEQRDKLPLCAGIVKCLDEELGIAMRPADQEAFDRALLSAERLDIEVAGTAVRAKSLGTAVHELSLAIR